MKWFREDPLANKRIRKFAVVLLGGVWLLSWYDFGFEFSRRWHGMGLHSRFLVILFLVAYPFPYLHLLKKEPQPIYIVGLTYVLLSVASRIIFPTLP